MGPSWNFLSRLSGAAWTVVSRSAIHAASVIIAETVQADPDISEPKLIAYRLREPNLELAAAPGSRAWMDATPNRFANRCLPLRIANQAGWFILNAEPVEAIWHGGDHLADIDVSVLGRHLALAPTSHFGFGVLTWTIPYLFRTPPGYNLVVRGPANGYKDGIVPLDGIVETDWALATFTMNWKFTRPGLRVRFEAGEPICMIFPQKRHEIESFLPEIRAIESAPEIRDGHQKWSESRARFSREMHEGGASVPPHLTWQKHYFHGHAPAGHSARASGQTGDLSFPWRNASLSGDRDACLFRVAKSLSRSRPESGSDTANPASEREFQRDSGKIAGQARKLENP